MTAKDGFNRQVLQTALLTVALLAALIFGNAAYATFLRLGLVTLFFTNVFVNVVGNTLLMAAGYTIKELMEYMGHADLQMVNRYVKLLPQPGEDDAAARLNDYLRRSASDRLNT